MAAIDPYASNPVISTYPIRNAASVTPNDSTDLTHVSRAIYVGGAGDMQLTTAGGDTVTLIGLLVGTYMPIEASRIWSTSTTATNIVALW